MNKSVRQLIRPEWIGWHLLATLMLFASVVIWFVNSVKPGNRTFESGVILGFLGMSLFFVVANMCVDVFLSPLDVFLSPLDCQRFDLRSDGLFDLASIEALSEQELSRRKLYLLLLAAISYGRTRLRLEPCRHDYRVYGTVNDIERELVPLDRDEGSKVITAMKAFAEQHAAGSAESGVQLIPILVGSHRVSLSLETLRYGEEEGISIRIEDQSLNTATAEGETGSPPSSFVKDHCEGKAYIDELQALVNRIGIRRDELHSVGCDTDGGQAEKRSDGSQ